MKDSEYYICEFCYGEYKPKRRKVQKYCSNTCRSKACIERNNEDSETKAIAIPKTNTPTLKKDEKLKVEKISMAGVGNAALGSLAADGIKSLAIPNHLKPATKGDINNLLEKLNSRYLFINNLPRNQFGQSPYYDVLNQQVVYLTFIDK